MSGRALGVRSAVWLGCALSAALVGSLSSCATGVDVSSADLAEICQGSDVVCGSGAETANAGANGISTAGAGGSSGSGQSGSSTGGTPSTPSGNGGTGGTNGASGSNGSSGTNNGSNNGSAGTGSGSAGTGGGALQPLAAGTCMAGSDQVAIVYTDRSNGKDATNQMTMVLHVNNTGASIDLTKLTIRYWFTDDGASGFTGEVDYAALPGGLGKGDVTVTFAQALGSNYAEIGFSGAGTVDSAGIDQIQLRMHTGGYDNFNQANDFSYQGNANATANRNITPYVNGTQVGGCVPAGQ